jgi:hypothetical protein
VRKTLILAILCLAGTAFAGYSYNDDTKVLTLQTTDLVTVIDPAGLADVQQSFGVSLASFRLLDRKVIDFGNPAWSIGERNCVAVNVAGLVQFDFASAYSYGGKVTWGRSAFSGPNAWDCITSVETQPGNSWFGVPAVVAAPGVSVSAVGFCVCSHDTTYGLSHGSIQYTLSDSSIQTVDYPDLGNGSGLNRIFIGYQAPVGKSIVSFRAVQSGSGNSFVNIDDLAFVYIGAAAFHPGDANGDGAVDVTDLGILAKNYDTLTGATWAMCDFNGDGAVDVTDLGILAKNYDWAAGASSVPEPGSVALIAMGGLALLRRSRRK